MKLISGIISFSVDSICKCNTQIILYLFILCYFNVLHRFNLKVRPDQVVPMEDLLTVLMLRSKTGLCINIHPRKSDVWHDENDNCTHIELENHC